MAFYHNIRVQIPHAPLIGFSAVALLLLLYSVVFQWRSSIVSPHAAFPESIVQDIRKANEPLLKLLEQSENERQRVVFEMYSPRNSTLGFERILALSKGTSWRRQGLLAAAQLSSIAITIPPQPSWSKGLADSFENLGEEGATKPHHGSAMAWLAHIDLLKYIIQSKLNSALVLEDDVDWDVDIKNQMTLIADAVRNHTNAPDEDIHPYSHLWDVLWIGHCGDNPGQDEKLTVFQDKTNVPFSKYVGWARGILSRISEGQRAVYNSNGAVCSFAYAVNKGGARKVLDFVMEGQDEAFDIKLMNGCRSNAFKCIVVNPEVMRHFRPLPEYGEMSEVANENDHKNGDAKHQQESPDREDGGFGPLILDQAKETRGTTENILNSARCKSLWKTTCLQE